MALIIHCRRDVLRGNWGAAAVTVDGFAAAITEALLLPVSSSAAAISIISNHGLVMTV